MAVAQFLEGGGYEHHLRRIRREYAAMLPRYPGGVAQLPGRDARLTPERGFILWVQMPDRVDSLELYKLSKREDITLTPGYLFSTSNQFRNFVRINAADWSYQIQKALETLGGWLLSWFSRTTPEPGLRSRKPGLP